MDFAGSIGCLVQLGLMEIWQKQLGSEEIGRNMKIQLNPTLVSEQTQPPVYCLSVDVILECPPKDKQKCANEKESVADVMSHE